MGIARRIVDAILALPRACRRLCGLIHNSPLLCFLVCLVTLIIVIVILILNLWLARLFTVPGAFVTEIVLSWLLLRLIVRALVFPGSTLLWKRKFEAGYRVEMSKQFAYHLEHLQVFLVQATGQSRATKPTPTMDGVLLGCMVVEGLSRNFRMQQRDEVRFTAEQARVKLLIDGVATYLNDAKVCEQRKSNEVPTRLLDWMQRISRSIVPVPLSFALAGTLLEEKTKAEAAICIDRLEQLIDIFVELQHPVENASCASMNVCYNASRFMRVPTVGSLHQLRAELLVRYSGQHCWVKTTSGTKLDAMLISYRDASVVADEGIVETDSNEFVTGDSTEFKDDVPLKSITNDSSCSRLGSVIIWCNPNAAYYETMAYESHWLDFYLRQGCNVLLFNYSGFGRSQGNATPRALASDGIAVVEFLKRRGFTRIGVHGRSIGGIAACSIAQAYPHLIKLLVADRTFSTLGSVAKFTFGNWAVKGLSIAATWADNHANFARARCYKVMICDPKDATVPDLAALRTAVGMHALEAVPPSNRLMIDTDKLQRLADAWTFIETLISICDGDGISTERNSDNKPLMEVKLESKRPARQPVMGKPSPDADVRVDVGEDDTQQLVSPNRFRGADIPKCVLNTQWLEEHVEVVRSLMSAHIDIIRLALDLVGTNLNASGMTLDEVFNGGYDDTPHALRCFLANLQVWGSLGSLREPKIPGTDWDIELLLQKGADHHETPEQAAKLQKRLALLTPDYLAAYHRHLTRDLAAQVRREFRQHIASVRRALEPMTRDTAHFSSQLSSVVLANFGEIEHFLTSIYRFFKCMDISGEISETMDLDGTGPPQMDGVNSSDDSEEGRERTVTRPSLRPTLDRSVTGYVMCIDCGHNGVLHEGEIEHLALHLRAAKFGKYDISGDDGFSVV